MREITSGDVGRMISSSSAALLVEIDQKRRRWRTLPWGVIVCFVLIIGSAYQGAPPWLLCVAAALSVCLLIAAHQFDLLRRTVVMMYDLDGRSEEAYRSLTDAADTLSGSGGLWHVRAEGDVHDPKYHAGASGLVDRNAIRIASDPPKFIRTNVPVCRIPLGREELCLFPDRAFVFTPREVGAVEYDELKLTPSEGRFIEDGRVPRDARVVDRTWRYVNKGGGPDRRFKDNREIPVCLYEKVGLSSPTGLREVIQSSRLGAGAGFARAVRELNAAVAEARTVEPPSPPVEPRARPTLAAVADDRTRLEEAAFDALCCVMAADGRAEGKELAAIRRSLDQLGAT